MQNQNRQFNFDDDPTEEFVVPYRRVVPYIPRKQRFPAAVFIGLIALVCSIISVVAFVMFQSLVNTEPEPIIESTNTPVESQTGITLLQHCQDTIEVHSEVSVTGVLYSYQSPNRADWTIIDPTSRGILTKPICIQMENGVFVTGDVYGQGVIFEFTATSLDDVMTPTNPATINSPTLTPEISPNE